MVAMLTDDTDRLIDFVSNLAGNKFLKVEKDLGNGYVRLNVTEAEKRQARHDITCVEDCVVEIIRNSRDAGAKKIFIATSKDSDGKRQLWSIDDGCGVPERVQDEIFEPRVTSKLNRVIEDRYGVHGRGMALYSIRSSPAVLKLLASSPSLGSVFFMEVSTEKLKERKDQSTYPKIRKIKGCFELKGPLNIPRLITEFSLDHPDVKIYYGSPSEILATLIGEGKKTIMKSSRNSIDAAYWMRFANLDDAEELIEESHNLLDLKISKRNAQRIISGEVRGVSPVGDRGDTVTADDIISGNIYEIDCHLTKNILAEDIEKFSQAIKLIFRQLEEKYFVKLEEEPKLKCGRKQITITLSLVSDQEETI